MTDMLHKAKRLYLCKLNPSDKKVWTAVKHLTKKPQPCIPTPSRNGCTASTSAEKASMLDTFFCECFKERPTMAHSLGHSTLSPQVPRPALNIKTYALCLLLYIFQTRSASCQFCHRKHEYYFCSCNHF